MYVSVMEFNGRENPIQKVRGGIVEEVYRVRLRESGENKMAITMTTNDADLLEETFPNLSATSRYEVVFTKLEIRSPIE